MLDLVPLARSRWVVANCDRETELVSKDLEVVLPSSDAASVASSRVRTDQQILCFGIVASPNKFPPTSDTGHCELRRVVRHANIHKAFVASLVVRAVGNSCTEAKVGKVLAQYLRRLSLGKPGFSCVFEVPYALLLLRVDGNDRLSHGQESLDLLVDVSELLVSLRRRKAFLILPVCLQ